MNRDELKLACFGVDDLPDGTEILEDVHENGLDVLSHLDLSYRRVLVMLDTAPPGAGTVDASETLTVAAIMNVCTDPAYRGQGKASGLLEMAHDRARSHPMVRFAALFSSYLDFYSRVGYQPTSLPDFLVCPLYDDEWPSGRIRTGAPW